MAIENIINGDVIYSDFSFFPSQNPYFSEILRIISLEPISFIVLMLNFY